MNSCSWLTHEVLILKTKPKEKTECLECQFSCCVNFFFFLLAVYCNLRMELKENDDWMDSVIGLFIDRCDRKAVGVRKFCIIGWLEKKVKTGSRVK